MNVLGLIGSISTLLRELGHDDAISVARVQRVIDFKDKLLNQLCTQSSICFHPQYLKLITQNPTLEKTSSFGPSLHDFIEIFPISLQKYF